MLIGILYISRLERLLSAMTVHPSTHFRRSVHIAKSGTKTSMQLSLYPLQRGAEHCLANIVAVR